MSGWGWVEKFNVPPRKVLCVSNNVNNRDLLDKCTQKFLYIRRLRTYRPRRIYDRCPVINRDRTAPIREREAAGEKAVETMVEPVPENLKWSLKVPSLQELMKDPKLDEVPPRYLWDGNCIDADVKASDPHRELEVPRIDMAKLMEEDYEGSQRAELLRLRSACKDWGTFQVITF